MSIDAFAEHLAAIASGEKPLPLTKAKRHHYVPQFLLRNFTTPSVEGEPKLRLLDKTTGKIESVTTKGTAWERNLYTQHDDSGKRDNRVESFLSVIESHAAEAVERFLADPLDLDYGDRVIIAIYLALQEGRTPAALAERRELLRQTGTMSAAVAMNNAHGKRKRMREAQEALLSGRVLVEPSDGATLSTMLIALTEVAEVISNLPWVLMRATEGEFVLSDRPLTRHDPAPPHKFSTGAWASSALVYTTLSLDPLHCLRISPNGDKPIKLKETTRHVTKTNLRTYGWGTRYILGRSDDALAGLHALALREPERVPLHVPQRLVILEDTSTADPAQVAANRARGWEPYVMQRTDDGFRRLSYTVIESVDDARTVMAPKPVVDGKSDDPA